MDSSVISLPSLPSINFAVVVSSTVLLIVLGVFFIIYLIISSVLFYHWNAYGMGSRGIVFGESIFLIVSVCLFVVAFLSASYY